MYALQAMSPDSSPSSNALTPAEIRQAYQASSSLGTGAGETIAIVDAYDDPNIQSDLNTFDTQFGLPAVDGHAGQRDRRHEPARGRLDAAAGSWRNRSTSSGRTPSRPGRRSCWSRPARASDERPARGRQLCGVARQRRLDELGRRRVLGRDRRYDSDFSHAGVAFVASSGDSGAPISWPAASPNVLAVGGTALTLSRTATWSAARPAGAAAAAARAPTRAQPSYQSGVVTQHDQAGQPGRRLRRLAEHRVRGLRLGPLQRDEPTAGSRSAAPAPGAPQWSALLAIADQGRAAAGQPAARQHQPAGGAWTTLYKNDHGRLPRHHQRDQHRHARTTRPAAATTTSPAWARRWPTWSSGSLDGTLDADRAEPITWSISLATPTTARRPAARFSVTVTADTSSGAVDPGYLGTVQLHQHRRPGRPAGELHVHVRPTRARTRSR